MLCLLAFESRTQLAAVPAIRQLSVSRALDRGVLSKKIRLSLKVPEI